MTVRQKRKTKAEVATIRKRLQDDPSSWTVADDTLNPLIKGSYECPDADTLHTSAPADYKPSTGRSPTHTQVRCPSCGFYSRWVPDAEVVT